MGAANSGSSTSTNYVHWEAMYSSYTLGDNEVLCAWQTAVFHRLHDNTNL